MPDDLIIDFVFVPNGAPWPADWVRRHPDYITLPARFKGTPEQMRRMFGKYRTPPAQTFFQKSAAGWTGHSEAAEVVVPAGEVTTRGAEPQPPDRLARSIVETPAKPATPNIRPAVREQSANAAKARAQELRIQRAKDLENPNIQAFLAMIAVAEGGDYHALYGYKKSFTDDRRFPAYDRNPSASGRYQINKATYERFSKMLGVTDFSPHTQDMIAAQMLAQLHVPERLASNDFDKALEAAARWWNALPQGKGKLDRNRKPEQPYVPYEKIKAIYDAQQSMYYNHFHCVSQYLS